MNKTLVLQLDSDYLYFKYLKSKYKLEDYYCKKFKNFFFYFLKLLDILHISIFLFLGNWKKEIKKFDTVVIIPNNYNYGISKYIKRKNKKCKIICYFLNVICETNQNVLKDQNIDEFWTFDQKDSAKYKMNYYPQFFSKEVKLEKKKILYDTIFLGRDKGRKKDLEKIDKVFKKMNLKSNIMIISNEKEYIEYQEYLDLISESKTILEIVDAKQSGMTLRCMESIFLNKKLITNDKKIKDYDFYNKNNIFVIGIDNYKDLKNFINTKYQNIDRSILKKYEYGSWLNALVKKK